MGRWSRLGRALFAGGAVVGAVSCPATPEPCLWTVTNNVGSMNTPTDLVILQLREPGSIEWGENILGEQGPLPFGESFSFLLAPGVEDLDVRGWDAEANSWSQFEAHSCTNGERLDTVLTSDDLDVPCTWRITNRAGDSQTSYALLDVWVRIAGTVDWGPGLLEGVPLPFQDTLEVTVETGFAFDLSAADQDGVYYLENSTVECVDGEELETIVSLDDEAPPCVWQVTNGIDGALGPLRVVQLVLVPLSTGQPLVYDLANTLGFGDVTEVPFFPRDVYDLQVVDEIGQTYTYPQAALCLDGGELYALEAVAEDVDP